MVVSAISVMVHYRFERSPQSVCHIRAHFDSGNFPGFIFNFIFEQIKFTSVGFGWNLLSAISYLQWDYRPARPEFMQMHEEFHNSLFIAWRRITTEVHVPTCHSTTQSKTIGRCEREFEGRANITLFSGRFSSFRVRQFGAKDGLLWVFRLEFAYLLGEVENFTDNC